MKNKTVLIAISLTAIASVGMLIFMNRQADETRQASNSIMEQFKKVDESLQRKNDSIEKSNDSIESGMEIFFDSTK